MSSESQEALGNIWNSPHGRTLREVDLVLIGQGFEPREGRKYRTYRHREHTHLKIVVPRHRQIKPWVIRRVTQALSELATLGG